MVGWLVGMFGIFFGNRILAKEDDKYNIQGWSKFIPLEDLARIKEELDQIYVEQHGAWPKAYRKKDDS